MGTAVTLDSEFVDMARSRSSVEHRSVPRQIEHWAKIGRIAEENPDLSYDDIRQLLLGLEDVHTGRLEPYRPGTL